MGFAMGCLCGRSLLTVLTVMLHVSFLCFKVLLEAPKDPKHDQNEMKANYLTA